MPSDLTRREFVKASSMPILLQSGDSGGWLDSDGDGNILDDILPWGNDDSGPTEPTGSTRIYVGMDTDFDLSDADPSVADAFLAIDSGAIYRPVNDGGAWEKVPNTGANQDLSSLLIQGRDFRNYPYGSNESIRAYDVPPDASAYDWTRKDANPLIEPGPSGSWDAGFVSNGTIIKVGQTYHAFYLGDDDNGVHQVGHATSADLESWTKDSNNPVLPPGSSGTWDEKWTADPCIVLYGDTYYMFYTGQDSGGTYKIGLATSPDLKTWTKHDSNPILSPQGTGWESSNVYEQEVIRVGETFHMLYAGNDGTTAQIGHATSTDGVAWSRDSNNPVITTGASGDWDDSNVLNPAIVRSGDDYHVFFRGDQGDTPSAKLGRASGPDLSTGLSKSAANPEFTQGPSGSWDDTRISGPSIMMDGGKFVLMYHGNDSTSSAGVSIGIAEMDVRPPT